MVMVTGPGVRWPDWSPPPQFSSCDPNSGEVSLCLSPRLYNERMGGYSKIRNGAPPSQCLAPLECSGNVSYRGHLPRHQPQQQYYRPSYCLDLTLPIISPFPYDLGKQLRPGSDQRG